MINTCVSLWYLCSALVPARLHSFPVSVALSKREEEDPFRPVGEEIHGAFALAMMV